MIVYLQNMFKLNHSKVFFNNLECTDDMGLDSGAMDPKQVTVSSSRDGHFKGRQAALQSSVGWIPMLNSQSEYIQVKTHTQLFIYHP